MAETKYGIISDTHTQPKNVPVALELLKREGVDKLILNGDIGSGQDYMAFTLGEFAKTNLETFVLPGSHESLADFEPVIKYFSDKHQNIVNTFERQKIESKDHNIVFLQGSDFLCGGQYQLANVEAQSGFYKTNNGDVRLVNMNDLRKLVTNSDKTIVISHVPRKFNGEKAVDIAYFAERQDGAVVPGVVFEEQVRRQIGRDLSQEQLVEVARQNGFSLRRENRGNEDLKKLYEEIGIKKSITGHFHESVHKAHDSSCESVEPGVFVDSLFWNASYLDEQKIGILTVQDARISYKNMSLH